MSFPTAAELNAYFVSFDDYVEKLNIAADAAPAAIDGLQLVFVDTTLLDRTITLAAKSVDSPRYSPWFINVGANQMIINASGSDVMNGSLTTVSTSTKYACFRLVPAADGYTIATKATP